MLIQLLAILVVCSSTAIAEVASSEDLPYQYPVTVVEGRGTSEQMCPPGEQIAAAMETMNLEIRTIVLNILYNGTTQECSHSIGRIQRCPVISCNRLFQLYPTLLSGYYWVSSPNGTSFQTYCDMTRGCCGSTGGWMRVAHLAMTDPSQECPTPWRETNYTKRVCRKENPAHPGCDSVVYPTYGVEYSRVCGRAIGYLDGIQHAFFALVNNNHFTINDPYVDGLSITHGSPRQHIWTFATATTYCCAVSCPCDNPLTSTPPWVAADYFCEVGDGAAIGGGAGFKISDPLWDGENCPQGNCCDHSGWFCKELPQPATHDIEVRLCENQADVIYHNAPPIELIEIYIM